jgi:YD repeat-containing protein
MVAMIVLASGMGLSQQQETDTTGQAWAWGYNAYGQLGNGTTTSSNAPVQVSGLSGVQDIASGAFHSLAVATSYAAVDKTAPTVTSTSPKANATEAAPTANVRATFSEEMDSSTINATTFQLFKKGTTTQIPAHVSYNADTDTAKLDPTDNLRRGVAYKAVVTTWAKDVAGNRLDQDSSTTGFQQMRWFFRVDD